MPTTDIAIVGLAAHFPGAPGVDQFWTNLAAGVESVRTFTPEELRAAGVADATIRERDYVRAGVPLDGLDQFDAPFFGLSPKDAAIMDPQHRHFLECAWEAMENAGYPAGTLAGTSVGVFAGCGPNAYLILNLLRDPDLVEREGHFVLRHTGNDKDVLATRVSYVMDLRGPSMTIQTACSTSLVAVHVAVQSLLNRECDIALAGAVSIELPHAVGYLYREGEILSRDGHCRAFDADATGTVFGSGAGAVVLRRLDDALAAGDTVHAVIKGSAINNDGSRKVGYLAPSVEGQVDVITEALAAAGVEPDSIDYIEAHGTGTAVGDPIELRALTQVFGPRGRPLRVGSVKTNFGHLDTAAGMAGLIKTILALRHRALPATLHFRAPNPRVDFDGATIRVVDHLTPWDRATLATPRRAGVTSLGIGGTNAHVVLEEAPEPEHTTDDSARDTHLLTLSARSSAALETATDNLARFLAHDPSAALDDVAYTLHVGRTPFAHRRTVVVRDASDAVATLTARDPARIATGGPDDAVADRPVAFLFSGQGAQQVGMGRALYDSEAVFRQTIDACAALAQPHLCRDIREILYPTPARAEAAAAEISETWNTQPLLFAVEYALAQLWMSWGIRPAKLLGHSIGEYVAACLAGVFTLDDAVATVCARGLLMRDLPGSGGAMLAVARPEQDVRRMTDGGLSLAAVNGPDQCVVAGPTEAIEALAARLAADGTPAKRLRTSHAFHSSVMDPMLEPFAEVVRRARLGAPTIPVLSNVSGTWLSAEQATDPAYWAGHVRGTVRFNDGLERLLAEPGLAILEVGPGETLAALARQHPSRPPRQPVFASLPRTGHTLDTLGKLWIAGAPVDWQGVHARERRWRVPLPTYPFERRRHWIGPNNASTLAPAGIDGWFSRPVWTRSPLQRREAINTGPWLVVGDGDGTAAALTARLTQRGVTVVTDAHTAAAARPRVVIYLAALDTDGAPEDRCFHDLVALLQRLDAREPIEIIAVSRRAQSVNGETVLDPYGALLAGPCLVAPLESSDVRCRRIDVDAQAGDALADLIMAEMGAAPAANIAYRDGTRWTETIARTPLAPGPARLRARGVYLITGGLGGIGQEIAAWLRREYDARVVLTSRHARGAPAPDEHVLVLEADVTNPADMRGVLDAAHARFGGQLHGVIHAAGVLDDGVIARKTRDAAARVLAPKVDGTCVLAAALADEPLDFLALFSSVSAVAPPAGQVDYCAANAFLNAFALSQPPERNATAIAWGRWSETGIGASAAGRLSVERDWILSEHRFSGGDALLPGTGQMEMAIAAARAKIGSGPIELRDVVFLAPLRVTPGQPRTVDITADAIPSGYRVAIADEGTVFCSCTSTALDAARAAAPRLDVEAIARRCRARDITDPVNARQQGHFEFGPHWSSLRRIQFGEGECLATLALPDAYAQEVNAYSLHPALMDVATGAAMFLVPGYDAPGDLMLPFSYKRVTIYGALPARIYSHIRAHGTGHADVATFDLTIADANGTVVSEIEEFAVRRLAVAPVPDAAPPVTRIATRDGLVAFRRLMSAHTPAVVYVSPADIRVASASPAAQSVSGTATKDAVPDDDIERTLGAIWQRLLGLDHVGPEADFFASGGQSLMAVRLFSEIRKRFDVDLGLSTLFDAPTLGALATTIRRARTPSTVTRPAGLVTIRPGGSRPPLFLIHSIGGRVLNYRDLSQHFPPDQPVYGIESRGLYGLEPHYRIEDMAAHYVALIREVQPHGPYFLAGHSFGGLVAHEMSRQLEVLGQPVGLVGVIDTLLRETPEVLRQAGPQNAWRRRLQTLRSPNRGEYIAMVLVARYSATQRAAYRLMHRALSRVGLKPPARLASVEQANWTAFHDHVPAPGRGPVVLFRCESRSRWDHPDPHMGWDEIAGGGVEVRSIPGDHLAMMHGDPARLIAEGLAECVARVRVPVP